MFGKAFFRSLQTRPSPHGGLRDRLGFWWRQGRIAVMGGSAILHLRGAVLLVWLASRRCKTGAFEDTRTELKKDELWLSHLTAKH